MDPKGVYIVCIVVLLPAQSLLRAQGPQPTPETSATDTVTELSPAQIEQLDRHRQIITDTQADSKSRRLMAESLLQLDFTARNDLAIELLSTPGASIAICEAIVSVGTKDPALLDPRLIVSLLDLLDVDDADLSFKAALALSAFRDGNVAQRLGQIASDADRPIAQRIAAVEALALSTDRREVVEALIKLTALPEATVVTEVVQALRPVSRADYGQDLEAWGAWWRQKEALDDAAWLRDRLDLAARHNLTLRAEIARLRSNTHERRKLVTQRVEELLRRIYQLTGQQAQRESLIQQWLVDPMEEYRLCALHLVRERIAEGDTPAEEVRLAVKDCFSHFSPTVRVAALEIIGNLRNPDDADDVLSLLAAEQDPLARETVLRVLGRLENPVAIDALVVELTKTAAPYGCIREAAIALGALGAQGQLGPATMAPAIEPLRQRFAAAPDDALRLKEALLSAMASIGDGAFQPEFVANLSSGSPELLLAAIRGIETGGGTEYLDAILSHLSHVDPRVRQLAAKAVGALGTADAHLQALITKLNPDEEANEGVRNAAWEGFRAILFRIPSSKRLAWIERLDRLPDRQIMLLEELIDERAVFANSADGIAAREKLAHILMSQDKYAGAIPHLQQLRKYYIAGNQSDAAMAAGVELIRACLWGERHERLTPVIAEVMAAADAPQRQAVTHVVFEYCENALQQKNTAILSALLDHLSALQVEAHGPDWSQRLQGLSDKLLSIENTEPAPDEP